MKEKIAWEHSCVSFTPKYLPRGRGLLVCCCVYMGSAIGTGNNEHEMTESAPEDLGIRSDAGIGIFVY